MGAQIQHNGWRRWVAVSLFAPVFCGCTGTWDRISANHYWDAPIHNTFHRDEPIEVLRKGDEPNARALAMLEVKEPKRNGGTDAEQDEVLRILEAAATSDKQAYCRMCAIKALGSWEDPRAAQIVLAAYQNAPKENPLDKPDTNSGVVQARYRPAVLGPVSSYTAGTIIAIRCRALESLGKKRSPEGLALLCQVASTPAKREIKEAKWSEMDLQPPGDSGQDQQDLRLAAIRALAYYKDDVNAARVLYRVMKTEHDTGLKGRAYLSLRQVTGKSYQPDDAQWQAYLGVTASPPPSAPAPAPAAAPVFNSGIQQVGAMRLTPAAGPANAPPANAGSQPLGNAGAPPPGSAGPLR